MAPSTEMRTAQWPHQEAEGTRRTRSRGVHSRICGGLCTEHWSLFARTPERRKHEEEERRRGSVVMEEKMQNKIQETLSFVMLNNSIDPLDWTSSGIWHREERKKEKHLKEEGKRGRK